MFSFCVRTGSRVVLKHSSVTSISEKKGSHFLIDWNHDDPWEHLSSLKLRNKPGYSWSSVTAWVDFLPRKPSGWLSSTWASWTQRSGAVGCCVLESGLTASPPPSSLLRIPASPPFSEMGRSSYFVWTLSACKANGKNVKHIHIHELIVNFCPLLSHFSKK